MRYMNIDISGIPNLYVCFFCIMLIYKYIDKRYFWHLHHYMISNMGQNK